MAVRIGILGCARIAKAAIIDVASEVPELLPMAVASRTGEKSQSFARAHGLPFSYDSYEDLLRDEDLDAIYIPLPNSMHAQWTLSALENGKAVLCEKPMALNYAQASEMASTASRLSLPFMEAFHYRYHPMMRFILDQLRTGECGKILSMYASLEIPAGLAGPDDIRFQANLGGGAMMDVGAYCINAMRYVAQEEPEILSASATLVCPGVDGAMSAKMEFPSGIYAELQCSLKAQKFEARLKIVTEHGWLEATNPFLPQMGNKLTTMIGGKMVSQSFEPTPTYVFQARAFSAFVQGEATCLSTAADGVSNMHAIDRIYLAAGLSPRG